MGAILDLLSFRSYGIPKGKHLIGSWNGSEEISGKELQHWVITELMIIAAEVGDESTLIVGTMR